MDTSEVAIKLIKAGQDKTNAISNTCYKKKVHVNTITSRKRHDRRRDRKPQVTGALKRSKLSETNLSTYFSVRGYGMFVRSDFSVLKAPSLFRWHDADSYRMLPILYPNTCEPGFAYLYSPQPSSPFCLSCPCSPAWCYCTT